MTSSAETQGGRSARRRRSSAYSSDAFSHNMVVFVPALMSRLWVRLKELRSMEEVAELTPDDEAAC